MSTQQTPTSGKKKLRWLFLPFIIIVILILASKGSFSGISFSSAATFSPQQLMEFTEHDENYLAGECKEHDFDYSFKKDRRKNDSEYYTYEYTHLLDKRHEDKGYSEGITTWSDFPNRLLYFITDRKKYDNFWDKLNSLNPQLMAENECDAWYPGFKHYHVKNYIFVKYDYRIQNQAYCIVAFRDDRITHFQYDTVQKVQKKNINPDSISISKK